MNENLEFKVTTYGPNGEWGPFTVSLADLAQKDKVPRLGSIGFAELYRRVEVERDKLDRESDRRWAAWSARGAAMPRTEEVCVAERRLHSLWDSVRAAPSFSAYDERVALVHGARCALADLGRIALIDAMEAALAAQAR